MLNNTDILLLQRKGITREQLDAQLDAFRTGFPYLTLRRAAAVGEDILILDTDEQERFVQAWHDYKRGGHKVVKFVPASGAASRMCKDLFAYLDSPADAPMSPAVETFFRELPRFAFAAALDEICLRNQGHTAAQLAASGQTKTVVENLLTEKGLNYGNLPKGLLLFHTYPSGSRTPLEEHLAEAALYASSQGQTEVHFTVSSTHRERFEQYIAQVLPSYEQAYSIHYQVSFSEQKPSTDTIAANADNTPFRNPDGSLLFRPGGHGALLSNLEETNGEIVFVKNIDNVVPDARKSDTIHWKQVLAGVLVDVQQRAHAYLRLLDSQSYNHADIEDMVRFVRHDLHTDIPSLKTLSDDKLLHFLRTKLNRPIRVCGVVRNVGEPGGGPFVAVNPDGTESNQILESSQIDTTNDEAMKMFTGGTHFNPVDLVCALRDYKGQPFPLAQYTDPATGFISQKSKDGKPLKALELPGLWNGAMSNWSTLFIEVPLATFNPVKTINDLLREEHQ